MARAVLLGARRPECTRCSRPRADVNKRERAERVNRDVVDDRWSPLEQIGRHGDRRGSIVGTHDEVRMACGIDVEKTELESKLLRPELVFSPEKLSRARKPELGGA